jgi:hypothetical protein
MRWRGGEGSGVSGSHIRTSIGLSERGGPIFRRPRTVSQSGRVSGSGASGIGSWCEMPSSATTKLAERLKIASPAWCAFTRRVVKLLPSRMRSTTKRIGASWRPGRRK